MAVVAAVKFVQGATIGLPGQALFGTLVDGVVTISNGNDANVVRWKFEVLDVPPGSIVPVGVVQDGVLSTFTFLPDLRGGYLGRITVFSAGNVDSAHDARTFGVKEVSTRFIPSFCPRSEFGDDVLNFGGQLRGWAQYMEEWLHAIDVAAVITYGNDLDPASVSGNQIVVAATGSGGVFLIRATSPIVAWVETALSPQFVQAPRTADNAAQILTILAQGAFAGAAVNKDGGALVLRGGLAAAGGIAGGVFFYNGANLVLAAQTSGLVTFRSLFIWEESVASPTAGQGGRTIDALPQPFFVVAQSAFAGSVGANQVGGALVLRSGQGKTDAQSGKVEVWSGSVVQVASFAPDGSLTLVATAPSLVLAAGGPSLTKGMGVPVAVQPNGSVFLRTNGTNGDDGVYTRQGGVWFAVGGAGAVTYGLDLDPTSVDGAQKVIAATGSGGAFLVRATAPDIMWADTAIAPRILQAVQTADIPAHDMRIQSQAPFPGAILAPDSGDLSLITPGSEIGGVPGVITFKPGGLSKVTVRNVSTAFATGHKIALDDITGAGPKFYASSGAPVAADPNGSLFLREDGNPNSTAYVRSGGVWYALATALSAWTPALLTYLRGHYVADLEYVASAAWGEQSPVGNDLVVSGTAAGAALNGHATITHDAILDGSTIASFSLGRAGKISAFVVVKPTSTLVRRTICAYGDGLHELYSNAGDGKVGGNTGGVLFTGATVINGAFHVVGMTEDAAGDMKLYVDGVHDGTNASNAAIPTTSEFTIGARSDFTFGLVGDVAEAVAGAAIWTNVEIALLQNYYATKYGI